MKVSNFIEKPYLKSQINDDDTGCTFSDIQPAFIGKNPNDDQLYSNRLRTVIGNSRVKNNQL